MKKETGLLSVNDNFSLIDVEKWNRREIFFYFSRIAPTTYSVTSSLDITNMIKALKEHNLKFFPSFLWLSTTIINQHPEFRVAMKNGNIGYYSSLTPFYPTFHSSGKTISMLWTDYSPSLFEFYNAYLEDNKLYGENKGFWVSGALFLQRTLIQSQFYLGFLSLPFLLHPLLPIHTFFLLSKEVSLLEKTTE